MSQAPDLFDLKALADAVHAEGGAISCQLTHGGSVVTSVKVDGPTMSASGDLNKAGLMRGRRSTTPSSRHACCSRRAPTCWCCRAGATSTWTR